MARGRLSFWQKKETLRRKRARVIRLASTTPMSIKLKRIQQSKDTVATVVLLGTTNEGAAYARSEAEQKYIQQKISQAPER